MFPYGVHTDPEDDGFGDGDPCVGGKNLEREFIPADFWLCKVVISLPTSTFPFAGHCWSMLKRPLLVELEFFF